LNSALKNAQELQSVNEMVGEENFQLLSQIPEVKVNSSNRD